MQNLLVQKINIIENQEGLSKVIESITNKKYTVLALTSSEYIDRVQKFFNLRNAGKLPETYPINIAIK